MENPFMICRCLALSALVLGLGALPSRPLGAAEPTTATVAHVKLSGGLDEGAAAGESLFGATNETFKAKLDRIKKAQKDPKVQGLILEIDGAGIGWGRLHELRRAVADFRAAGKKAFAYLDEGDAKDYLAAAACDRVALPESGGLMITGLSAEVSFYKDLLDKLRIKVDTVKMGNYKGAVEPFTRTELSKENREQIESILDDHFDNDLVRLIVESRPGKRFTTEQVRAMIDQGPFTAKQALALGLIDKIAYVEDFEADLKKELGAEKVEVTRNYGKSKGDDVDMSNPFAIFKLLSPPKKAESKNPKVAVIYAVGQIATGKGGAGFLSGEAVGSTTMVEAIRKAEKDDTVKAIVLRVDSPGGSALASDLIWKELAKSKKPVVASMGDVAASGGYYICMAARKIYAEPGTLTGSIGVFGMKFVTGGLLDMAGVKTEVIRRGKHAGILSTATPYTDSERATMTALIQEIYDQFIDKALQGRKQAGVPMTREKLLSLAGGHVWTGRQAKANGLVDELGTLDDAIAAAKEMAGIAKDKEMELLLLPKGTSFLDRLMEGKSEAGSMLGTLPAADLLAQTPELQRSLRALGTFLNLRQDRAILMSPYLLEVK
jgi:protease-4